MNRELNRRQRKIAKKAAKNSKREQPATTIPQSINLALQHHTAGQLPEAESIYRQILQTDPNQPDALHLLGVIAHQMADNNTAVGLIAKSLAINPLNVDAHNNLGNALKELGRLDEAVACYQKAIKIIPDFAEAHNNLGNALKELGKLDEAVICCHKALTINPDYAEAHNTLGMVLQELGKLKEGITCYQKAITIKPDFAKAHYNLGTALNEHGRLDEAVASYHKALTINPGHAQAHSNLGNVYNKLGSLNEAVYCYNKALDINPDYTEAHINLGVALKELERLDEALDCYHKALDIDPDYAEAHNNLGTAFLYLGKLDEAVTSYHKALAIKPDYAEALSNLGNALKELGKLDEALESYRMALAINPDHADTHNSLGLLQLLRGDFQSGWKNIRWRWKLEKLAGQQPTLDCPSWEGKPIVGKRLLVWGDQGIGDQVIYAGMIPDIIKLGAEITLKCEPRLVSLFSRSFPEISILAQDIEEIELAESKKFDIHACLGDIGYWLRSNLSLFPKPISYLVPDSKMKHIIRERYLDKGNDFLVGISWHSKSPSYRQKSMTLIEFLPVLKIPGVTFVNLQYGDTLKEREAFAAKTNIQILNDDTVDQMLDIDLFAAQVAAMDMVVTISNTTAHFAGAIGIPTFLLLETSPIWYWMLDRDDSIWYPSMRLFRQTKRGVWNTVTKDVAKELKNLIQAEVVRATT